MKLIMYSDSVKGQWMPEIGLIKGVSRVTKKEIGKKELYLVHFGGNGFWNFNYIAFINFNTGLIFFEIYFANIH